MSEIGVILSLHGESVDEAALARMRDARAMRACDGVHAASLGRIGFVHKPFWTVPEDVGRLEPARSPDGSVVLVADARIDNRDELLREIPALAPSASDAECIAAAYEKWGDDCLTRLLGDFAFVLWDVRRARLLAACDLVGMRPLYYAERDGVLVLSGSFRMLFDALPHRPNLNLAALSAAAVGRIDAYCTDTVLDGVKRLLPGFKLVAESGFVRIPEPFDAWGRLPPPPCRTDADWIDAYNETLLAAVRPRLRRIDGSALSIAVSGGLDSSALACLIHERLPAESERGVYINTMRFTETPSVDEHEYFDAVAERCSRFNALRIPADGAWAFREMGEDGGFVLGEPDSWPMRLQCLAMFGPVTSVGGRVALWGMGGDLIAGLYTPGDKDITRTLPLAERIFEPGRMRARVRYWMGRFTKKSAAPRALLRPVASVPPPAAPVIAPTVSGIASPVARHMVRNMSVTPMVLLRNIHAMYARHAGVEQRTPYQDRRVVELAMHMPVHLLLKNGLTRVVMRDAARGYLPEKVRLRRDKKVFNALIERGCENERPRLRALVTDMRLAAAGLVDADAARAVFDAAESQHMHGDLMALAEVFALESWMRVYGY